MRFVPTLGLVILCAGSISFGAVHAQTAAAAPQQTTAVIDPPIVTAPPIPPATPKNDLTMPKWSEFPVPPKDVPTVTDIAARVKTQDELRKQLTAEVAALQWDGDDPQKFQTASVARIDPAMLQPVDTPMSAAAIEAFGNEMRQRAVPPPIVN